MTTLQQCRVNVHTGQVCEFTGVGMDLHTFSRAIDRAMTLIRQERPDLATNEREEERTSLIDAIARDMAGYEAALYLNIH